MQRGNRGTFDFAPPTLQKYDSNKAFKAKQKESKERKKKSSYQ
jgi:hypothetical protein